MWSFRRLYQGWMTSSQQKHWCQRDGTSDDDELTEPRLIDHYLATVWTIKPWNWFNSHLQIRGQILFDAFVIGNKISNCPDRSCVYLLQIS
jgi:hypothetical protein